MVKVGWNYGDKGKCPICLEEDDTQRHLLECTGLHDMNDNLTNDKYDQDSDRYDLTEHMTLLEAAIRKREIFQEERGKNMDPHGQK